MNVRYYLLREEYAKVTVRVIRVSRGSLRVTSQRIPTKFIMYSIDTQTNYCHAGCADEQCDFTIPSHFEKYRFSDPSDEPTVSRRPVNEQPELLEDPQKTNHANQAEETQHAKHLSDFMEPRRSRSRGDGG